MRSVLIAVGVLVCVTAVVIQAVHTRAEPATYQQTSQSLKQSDHSADEALIRANITEFSKAYDAGDAKAVAALFMPDGQAINKEGQVAEGREAIARAFEHLFKAMPQKKIEVSVESIRFIGSDLAVEVGTTKETPSPNEPPDYDRYTVLHVKRDGKWLMALARDEEGPDATPRERLQPLAWLVGDWVDDGGAIVVHSNCKWSEDGNFLLQEFNVRQSGKDAMRISQRIGWDPQLKQIRSWVFDSQGGFGESFWTRDNSGWIIKANGVSSEGVSASATNFIVPTGRDVYVWRSTDRVAGDNRQPPIEVRVVRKPPEPTK